MSTPISTPSEHAATTDQLNRTPIYISLGLAVLLVIGVLIGARIVSDRASDVPVGVAELPAPLADSAECTQLIDSLPNQLLGHKRATIAEPAPVGVAVWQTSEIERITLRCGVELPFQYTEYAQPVNIADSQWLVVTDATPGSTMSTWYSVDRQPVMAITADDLALDGAKEPITPLSEEIATLPKHQHDPNPAPLSELEAAKGIDDARKACAPLIDALPDTLDATWSRNAEVEPADELAAVWTAPGKEPIVMRCGVAFPPNYAAGEQLTQIDTIPWFEDTALVNGTTSSNWYALGREVDIAVSTPHEGAGRVLPELGRVIEANTQPE